MQGVCRLGAATQTQVVPRLAAREAALGAHKAASACHRPPAALLPPHKAARLALELDALGALADLDDGLGVAARVALHKPAGPGKQG